MENVLIGGDLSKLSPAERMNYYQAVCKSMGLNPLTKPFDYINLNGKLVLYAKRDCTDQLRSINSVSVSIISRERLEDVYMVIAKAVDRTGRTDESIGAVNITSLKGDALANALMKAETKAKRRVTLSIVGLGWLDETELETIPTAAQPTPQPEPESPETTEQPTPPTAYVTYTGALATIGKNKYPATWGQLLMANLKNLGGNTFEIDGILQKLALPQATAPGIVLEKVETYLAEKSA
jgi:hypothetical protein